jgi:Reverse transcriptase (RNA-dependent DNA polymerase)
MRLQKPSYPLNQSPLFRMQGRGQFQAVMRLEWDAVSRLLPVTNYRVWDEIKNGKAREIQQPIGQLAAVHKRIADLLARVELPDFLYSRKGRSYIDNALQHRGSLPLIKTDIHKFYPSTTWQMVYDFFIFDCECASDVAHQLSDLCCYQQKHVPTGSPLSGYLAYFASRHMFDEVASIAKKRGCVMTAYVDDITVSGQGATKELLGIIRRSISEHGLKTKQKKSLTYAATAAKSVTGIVIAGSSIRLPNKRHQKIMEARKALASAAPSTKDKVLQSLKGRLREAAQVLGKSASLNADAFAARIHPSVD